MKYHDWNETKNIKLKLERGVGFEDVINAIHEGNLLDVRRHHNLTKYPYQKAYIVKINDYVYAVPFVEDDEKYFLKTIYPSRKLTKQFLFERRK